MNLLMKATAALVLILSLILAAGRQNAEADQTPTETDPASAPAVTSPPIMTLSQCIDTALRKNPGLVAAGYAVESSRSRVGGARSAYYPQLTAQASYVRSRTTTETAGNVVNANPAVNTATGSLTLTQNFLDFGKTSSQVDISKFNLVSAQADRDTALNTVIFTVKQTYYGVLQAKRNRDVAADVIKQFQLHLDQAKAFYDVGTKARIDVIKAEVDLSNAKLNLINAENALKLARVNLNNAMGTPEAPEFTIEDNLSFQKYHVTLEEATKKALENRPDLASFTARRQAASENVSLQRSGYYPVLTGSASYARSEPDVPEDTNTRIWSVGVTLTVPLFSGFLTSHQVAEARSNLYALQANEELFKHQVQLEVRQAYLSLQAAEASIATAELAAAQAKENMDLANGRYAAGVGSPVEVSDAFTTYVSAQANFTGALSNYRIAQAAIERAMGAR